MTGLRFAPACGQTRLTLADDRSQTSVMRAYIYIRKTIRTLASMLRPLRINPHTTLLTLFLNAVMEI